MTPEHIDFWKRRQDKGCIAGSFSGFTAGVQRQLCKRYLFMLRTIARQGAEREEISMETDQRPWGYYEVLTDAPDHKVKRITVYPGKRLSRQRHRRRSEHWYLVRGQALVTVAGEELPLSPGQAVDIPAGADHRLANRGREDVTFIEVQTGDYFGEDDIERIEDDFGRV